MRRRRRVLPSWCGSAPALAARSDRPADAKGVSLPPLERRIDDKGYHYRWVDVAFDRARALGPSP